MNMLQRLSKLMSANINHLLDKAENPEVMIKQIIRDMEEGIIELRREAVKAIAREKQIEKRLELSRGRRGDLEKKAAAAVEKGDEEQARLALAGKLELEDRIREQETDLAGAREFSARLKSDLGKMEDQVQQARRKKEELIRRKRIADARLRGKGETGGKMFPGSLDRWEESLQAMKDYEEKISQLEAEAEASEELLNSGKEQDSNEEKAEEQRKKVQEELEKLKRRKGGRKGSS